MLYHICVLGGINLRSTDGHRFKIWLPDRIDVTVETVKFLLSDASLIDFPLAPLLNEVNSQVALGDPLILNKLAGISLRLRIEVEER